MKIIFNLNFIKAIT